MDLPEKQEDISGRSAELLEEMGRRREQLNILRRRQVQEREAARHRNATLLQDLQKIEDGLRGAKLTHTHLLASETRYWVSVEESVPAWEHFLLGKGPHPIDGPGQTARRNKHNPSIGLPPRPKPRAAR
ncbi:centrosomal protein 15 kDa [Limanda limanda]|uniref:centrosomal protein 15 kDa n=1 Tax=Limanda limanda TaxID=27771 RepID=UPI0029C99F37|nr:centrosomal protein 15 kDa [Limanda limanda]